MALSVQYDSWNCGLCCVGHNVGAGQLMLMLIRPYPTPGICDMKSHAYYCVNADAFVGVCWSAQCAFILIRAWSSITSARTSFTPARRRLLAYGFAQLSWISVAATQLWILYQSCLVEHRLDTAVGEAWLVTFWLAAWSVQCTLSILAYLVLYMPDIRLCLQTLWNQLAWAFRVRSEFASRSNTPDEQREPLLQC